MAIINSIRQLENIGSFKKFLIPGDLEFKAVNLFYGYNGSGKTTLTRIFDCLNKGELHHEWPSAAINISCDRKSIKKFTDSTIRGKVKIFNADFIAENLELRNYKAKQLSAVIGQSNIQARNELDKLQGQRNTLLDLEGNLKAEQEFKQAEDSRKNLKTGIAKQIREALALADSHSYTVKHFEESLKVYKKSSIPNIVKNSYESSITVFRAEEKPQIESRYIGSFKEFQDFYYRDSYEGIFALLEQPIRRKIGEIKEEIAQWLDRGINLQSENSDTCLFCNQDLTRNYWQQRAVQIQSLIKKDDEYERMETQLSKAKEGIEAVCRKLEHFSCDLRSSDFFTSILFETYEVSRQEFNAAFSEFKCSINRLKDKLVEKEEFKDKNILFDEKDKLSHTAQVLQDATNKVVVAIEDNNQAIDKSSSLKQQAKNTVINFHIQNEYRNLKVAEKAVEEKEAALKRAKQDLTHIETEIKNQLAILDNQQETISKINGKLKKILAGKLVFSFNSQTKEYSIERRLDDGSQAPAKNLSEGEKNLIAFLYFMISLDSSAKAQKKDEIIVIDDPASSVDSNNLFLLQVLTIAAMKGYGQKFFLTHNFYFFTKIRAALTAETKSSLKEAKLEDKLRIFEIEKTSLNGSIVKKANKYIEKHISEYMSLIEKLKQIYEDEASEREIATANIIRKVLEIFCAFKSPSSGSLYSKIQELTHGAPQYEVLEKIANAFSHTSEITDITGSSDYSYTAGRDEIKLLFQFMKATDETHCTGLDFDCILSPA